MQKDDGRVRDTVSPPGAGGVDYGYSVLDGVAPGVDTQVSGGTGLLTTGMLLGTLGWSPCAPRRSHCSWSAGPAWCCYPYQFELAQTLHSLQDSFSTGHTDRYIGDQGPAAVRTMESIPGPAPIRRLFVYDEQDHSKHADED